MTAVSTPLGTATAHKRATITPSRLLMDVWLLAERNLLKIWRRPRLIIFSIVQPIMQLILFVFVFGAIANLGDTGLTYKDFVVPAVLVQTMVFAGIQSGIGIADDMNTGMIDRFRSLPVARSGFLLGRTVSDGIRLSAAGNDGHDRRVRHRLPLAQRCPRRRRHARGGDHVRDRARHVLRVHGARDQGPGDGAGGGVHPARFPLIFTSSAFAPVSATPGLDAAGRPRQPGHVCHRHRRGLVLGDDALYKVSQVHLSTRRSASGSPGW